MNVVLDDGAFIPVKAHSTDAGFDLRSREEKIIPARGSAIFDTGIHVAIPEGYVGFLKSKSGLNVKHGIISDGTIDSSYTGSIIVKLYNLSDVPYNINIGDKITQLVVQPIINDNIMDIVDNLEKTERGDNGFGSTGK